MFFYCYEIFSRLSLINTSKKIFKLRKIGELRNDLFWKFENDSVPAFQKRNSLRIIIKKIVKDLCGILSSLKTFEYDLYWHLRLFLLNYSGKGLNLASWTAPNVGHFSSLQVVMTSVFNVFLEHDVTLLWDIIHDDNKIHSIVATVADTPLDTS